MRAIEAPGIYSEGSVTLAEINDLLKKVNMPYPHGAYRLSSYGFAFLLKQERGGSGLDNAWLFNDVAELRDHLRELAVPSGEPVLFMEVLSLLTEINNNRSDGQFMVQTNGAALRLVWQADGEGRDQVGTYESPKALVDKLHELVESTQ